MKNLIATLIFMFVSLFGFSQDTILKPVNAPYIDTINVTLGEHIIMFQNITNEQSMNVDTNFLTYKPFSIFTQYNKTDTIINYVINKNSKCVTWYLGSSTPTYDSVCIAFKIVKTGPPTSINEINDSKINFEIFPNPAKSEVNIKSETKIEKIEIINESGQIVKSNDLSFSEITEYKLNTFDLVNGLYFVRINGTDVKKLIINK